MTSVYFRLLVNVWVNLNHVSSANFHKVFLNKDKIALKLTIYS